MSANKARARASAPPTCRRGGQHRKPSKPMLPGPGGAKVVAAGLLGSAAFALPAAALLGSSAAQEPAAQGHGPHSAGAITATLTASTTSGVRPGGTLPAHTYATPTQGGSVSVDGARGTIHVPNDTQFTIPGQATTTLDPGSYQTPSGATFVVDPTPAWDSSGFNPYAGTSNYQHPGDTVLSPGDTIPPGTLLNTVTGDYINVPYSAAQGLQATSSTGQPFDLPAAADVHLGASPVVSLPDGSTPFLLRPGTYQTQNGVNVVVDPPVQGQQPMLPPQAQPPAQQNPDDHSENQVSPLDTQTAAVATAGQQDPSTPAPTMVTQTDPTQATTPGAGQQSTAQQSTPQQSGNQQSAQQGLSQQSTQQSTQQSHGASSATGYSSTTGNSGSGFTSGGGSSAGYASTPTSAAASGSYSS